MCGFVAVFLPQGRTVSSQTLDRATDSLAHRGPDGRGVFCAPGIGLGHRRLAIIDIEGGAQPFSDPSGAVGVFNGEVYNFRAARADLPGPWSTQSDTEVFLRAVASRGAGGLAPLSGMWGAGIWFPKERKLAVIRDRLGIKPVYYAELDGGGFVFASEIRALRAFAGVDTHLDLEALQQLLCYRYVPAPKTLFRGVKKLPPGHIAWVTEDGLRLESYWSEPKSLLSWTDAEAEAAYGAAFDRAVADRLVSDVPLGMFLSGGVDSTGILQSARRRDLYAVTVGFKGGERDDEIAWAAETARLYGAQHDSFVLDPDAYLERFDDYVAQLEEPVLNDSAMATWFLSERARKKVKVVLSGQGADEPLAGYDRTRGEFLGSWFRRTGAQRLQGLVEGSRAPEKLKRGFRSLGTADPLERALKIYEVFSDQARRAMTRPEVYQDVDVAQPLRDKHQQVPHLDPLGRMLYADTRMWLVDDLLMVADKLSMAAGLELRVPYCDHRLIELLETMPSSQKIRLSLRGIETKSVHRRVMRQRLPASVLRRRKLGFTNPMDVWLREGLRPRIQQRLLSTDSALHTIFEPARIEAEWAAHLSGGDRRRQLFLLLTLESWMRQNSPGISAA